MKAIRSASCWGSIPRSSPSGMSERPVEATSSMRALGTDSVTPSARFNVTAADDSTAIRPETRRPSFVATL